MKPLNYLSALSVACCLFTYYAYANLYQLKTAQKHLPLTSETLGRTETLYSEKDIFESSPEKLPNLGDSSSSHISPQQEFELGRIYLKIIRNQLNTSKDPELKDYLERLTFQLSEASEINDHRLITLLINNNDINAFAAPGGIIGVNTGLFLNAQTEAQFAAVLAHEFAHLSQRHYARNVKKSAENFLPVAAAVLGSVILMAAGAGPAPFISTMAGIQSSRLSFSRLYEREADNIGIKTLARAGYDPHAMPEIFQQMAKDSAYGSQPPEFLSTHPVTENRIADSQARASQFGKHSLKDSKAYQLMRMRTKFLASNNTKELLRQLIEHLPDEKTSVPEPTRYLIVIAATQTRDYNIATKQLTILLDKDPRNIHYIIAKARLDAATGQSSGALKNINSMLDTRQDAYPLIAVKSDILIQQKKYKESRDTLLKLSQQRFEDPDIWYELAEVQGLYGDNLGLHQSRAEYFFLHGDLDTAIRHIQYAQKLTGKNNVLKAKLDQKLTDMHNYQKKMRK